jgi:hypothetical protein
MKRIQLVVGLGLFSFAFANGPLVQKPIVYKDNAKNPRMVIQGNEGFFVPGESFELSGNVQIKRLASGGNVETLMTCSKATGNLLKIKDKMDVDKVRMTGGIKFIQSGEENSVTTSGDSAQYDIKGELREVNVTGDVHVDFGSKGKKDTVSKSGKKEQANVSSTMNTTSRSATLVFKKKVIEEKKEIAELQSALIRGPITFNGTQLIKDSSGEKLQKVFAKADSMAYSIKGESGNREVRLEGNLEFRELDGNNEGAMVEGASLLVLQLNDNGEIVKLKFTSSEGEQVKTTINKNTDDVKKKGGH